MVTLTEKDVEKTIIAGMSEKKAKAAFKVAKQKYGKKHYIQLIQSFPTGEWKIRLLKKVV